MLILQNKVRFTKIKKQIIPSYLTLWSLLLNYLKSYCYNFLLFLHLPFTVCIRKEPRHKNYPFHNQNLFLSAYFVPLFTHLSSGVYSFNQINRTF